MAHTNQDQELLSQALSSQHIGHTVLVVPETLKLEQVLRDVADHRREVLGSEPRARRGARWFTRCASSGSVGTRCRTNARARHTGASHGF